MPKNKHHIYTPKTSMETFTPPYKKSMKTPIIIGTIIGLIFGFGGTWLSLDDRKDIEAYFFTKDIRNCAFAQGMKEVGGYYVDGAYHPIIDLKFPDSDYKACERIGEEL